VGYTGATMPEASYEDVCTGGTRHAEAVEVTFGSAVTGYRRPARSVLDNHDPTTLNRRARLRHEYRSAIVFSFLREAGGCRARLAGEAQKRFRRRSSRKSFRRRSSGGRRVSSAIPEKRGARIHFSGHQS